MSRLSTISAAEGLERSGSALSNVSATTYHSFQDIELYEPGQSGTPCQDNDVPPENEDRSKPTPGTGEKGHREGPRLQRQDSGYESIPSRSRSRTSRRRTKERPPKEHRISTCSMPSAQAKSRSRPSLRRAARSNPTSRAGQSTASLYVVHPQPLTEAYYHFPALEGLPGSQEEEDECTAPQSYPPPPQTTHYWTSDHTRRLEYAAIDAASQGVKGWFLKHVVPDCFVPKENRRVGFDDDCGSVRRYRLDLDCEETDEKTASSGGAKKKMAWLFGR